MNVHSGQFVENTERASVTREASGIIGAVLMPHAPVLVPAV